MHNEATELQQTKARVQEAVWVTCVERIGKDERHMLLCSFQCLRGGAMEGIRHHASAPVLLCARHRVATGATLSSAALILSREAVSNRTHRALPPGRFHFWVAVSDVRGWMPGTRGESSSAGH